DAVIPLQDISFPNALLLHFGTWPLLPAHLLFPKLTLISTPIDDTIPQAVRVVRSLKETALLVGSLLIIFLLYLFALRRLPRTITFRYILISTTLLGIICMLIPVLTSKDV